MKEDIIRDNDEMPTIDFRPIPCNCEVTMKLPTDKDGMHLIYPPSKFPHHATAEELSRLQDIKLCVSVGHTIFEYGAIEKFGLLKFFDEEIEK